MKLNAYATYDTAAAVYSKPFFAQSDGQVMREFQDICVNAEHPFGQHPEDYSLHRIGSYNDQTAKLESETPECLATGLEMVALSRNVNRDQAERLNAELDEASKKRAPTVWANYDKDQSPGGTS